MAAYRLLKSTWKTAHEEVPERLLPRGLLGGNREVQRLRYLFVAKLAGNLPVLDLENIWESWCRERL